MPGETQPVVNAFLKRHVSEAVDRNRGPFGSTLAFFSYCFIRGRPLENVLNVCCSFFGFCLPGRKEEFGLSLSGRAPASRTCHSKAALCSSRGFLQLLVCRPGFPHAKPQPAYSRCVGSPPPYTGPGPCDSLSSDRLPLVSSRPISLPCSATPTAFSVGVLA